MRGFDSTMRSTRMECRLSTSMYKHILNMAMLVFDYLYINERDTYPGGQQYAKR